MRFEEIKEMARQYNVEVNLVGTNTLFLRSMGNTWFCYLDNITENINHKKKIYLFHKSHGNEKQHYHCQRKYGRFSDLLDSISTHDVHMFKERKKSRKELLFEMIENERKSKEQLHNKKGKSKRNIEALHNNINNSKIS